MLSHVIPDLLQNNKSKILSIKLKITHLLLLLQLWLGLVTTQAAYESHPDPLSPLPPVYCRVKAKKGVTLLGTKSRSGQWHVTSELLTGAKHSTATVDVAWAQGTPLPPW